ncbi:hypothetical protein JCM11641_003944 [Rhodosporidiobolus odoratus]
MSRRYSSSTLSSSDTDTGPSSSSRRLSSSSTRGRPDPPQFEEPLYDSPPIRKVGLTSSSSETGTETEMEDGAYKLEREERRRRQKVREAKAPASAGVAGGFNGNRKGKKVYEMKSLGLNKTQLKNILSPLRMDQTPDNASDKVPLTGPTDLEKQSEQNLKKRRYCGGTSGRRVTYIIVTTIVCLIIVALGVGLGLDAVHKKEEKEQALEEANPGNKLQVEAQNYLEEEAASAQSAMKAWSTGAAEGEEEDDADEEEDGEEEEEDDGSWHPDSTFAQTAVAKATSAPVTASASAVSHPSATSAYVVASLPSPTGVFSQYPELQDLLTGNREWRNETEAADPGLIEKLAEKEHPTFAYIGCSDSRVPETDVFGRKVGDMVVTRNVGNQYLIDDLSSETVMSYAIAHLGVQHVIVMGHTRCGAVMAAISSPSPDIISDIGETRIDAWIRPIRSLYTTSNRSEIVEFRESMKDAKNVASDNVTDEVWQAVIEENVKVNVKRVASDTSVRKSWTRWLSAKSSAALTAATPGQTAAAEHRKRSTAEEEPVELWVHGFLYDVSTGLVHDLGVSVGPTGPYKGS